MVCSGHAQVRWGETGVPQLSAVRLFMAFCLMLRSGFAFAFGQTSLAKPVPEGRGRSRLEYLRNRSAGYDCNMQLQTKKSMQIAVAMELPTS